MKTLKNLTLLIGLTIGYNQAEAQITGSGTAGCVPKFLTGSTVGNSVFFSNGSNGGVGVSTPIQTLDVNGRIHVANGVIQRGGSAITTTSDLGLYSLNSGNWMRFVTNSAAFRFFADGGSNPIGNTALVSIESNGNVGIGTTSPSQKLDVAGNIITNGKVFLNSTTRYLGASGNGDLGLISSDGTWLRLGSTNGLGLWGGAGAEVALSKPDLFINSTGQVSIGAQSLTSSSPHYSNYLVSVSGKLVAQELYVTTLNWADYVFKSDYKLQTLSEVEDYISCNGHLPNIPSEEEVKQNGVSVNEMTSSLLRKIEEMTLYMIEMDKELQQLKAGK